MCGIVAVASKDVNEHMIEKGILALGHRGPDGKGVYCRDNIGLGHTHLAIMDAVTGKQPLVSEDGKISAVVNGEFYEYENIQKELEQKGYSFASKSDSEILIYLYKELGLDFVNHLRGEFAFILYDSENDRLIAGRDRFGIKPLHYTKTGNGLYLASEAKALFAMGIEAELNRTAAYQALTTQYLLPGETLFENVFTLLPGHLLIHKNNETEVRKYWDLTYPTPENKTLKRDVVHQVHGLLKESVQIRLNTPQKCCCQLSGGIDSALIAAMISRLKTPIHCFTVAFPNDAFDESAKARTIADHIGSELTTVELTPQKIVQNLAKAIVQSEGVSIDTHLVAKYLLHQEMRENGYKVVFTGEGADEVFKGYDHLLDDHHQISSTQALVKGMHFSDGKELSTQAVQEAFGFVPCFLKGKASIGYKIRRFLKYPARQLPFTRITHNQFLTADLEGREKLDISSQLWIKLALGGYILKTLGDGTEMAFSMEGRVPYLDHILFDMVKRVPASMTLKDKVSKYILRQIARDYLPSDICQRTKQPFVVPTRNFLFSAEVLEYIESLINSEGFERLDIFEREPILDLLKRIPDMKCSEQTAYGPVVMIIVSLIVLYEHYIQK